MRGWTIGGRRCKALGRARCEGAVRGSDGQLEAPALVNRDMPLRKMHAHTLPQWSVNR